jgi:hypothetical protein
MLSIKLPKSFRLAPQGRRSLESSSPASRPQKAGAAAGMRELTPAELKMVSGR